MECVILELMPTNAVSGGDLRPPHDAARAAQDVGQLPCRPLVTVIWSMMPQGATTGFRPAGPDRARSVLGSVEPAGNSAGSQRAAPDVAELPRRSSARRSQEQVEPKRRGGWTVPSAGRRCCRRHTRPRMRAGWSGTSLHLLVGDEPTGRPEVVEGNARLHRQAPPRVGLHGADAQRAVGARLQGDHHPPPQHALAHIGARVIGNAPIDSSRAGAR